MTPAAEGPRPAGLGTNTAWNVADLSVGALTAIINSVVVARALGPTVLGRYQFILWAASIVSVLTMYGLPVTANRFIARYLATGHPDLAGTVVWKTIRYQALFALAAVLAGSAFALTRAPDERLVVLLVFLSLSPVLMMAVPTGVSSIDERFARNVIPSLCAEIGGSIAVVIVAVTGGSLVQLAAVTLGSRTLDAGLRYILAWPRLRQLVRGRAAEMPAEDTREFRQMIWQSVVTQLLMFVVWDRSEILFLERLSTSDQLAFFSVSFGLISNLRMIPTAAVRAQTPRILKHFGPAPEAARRTTISAMRQQLVIAIPGHLLAVAFAGDAVGLLYGEKYLAAVPVMMVLAALSLPGAVARPIEALLTAADGRRSILRLTAVTAGVTLVADFVLIALFDAQGAGVANGLVSLSQAVLLGFFAWRVAHLRFAGLKPWGLLGLGIAAVGTARLVTLHGPHLLNLVVGGIVGLGLYALGLWKGPFLSRYERERLADSIRGARDVLRATLRRSAAQPQ